MLDHILYISEQHCQQPISEISPYLRSVLVEDSYTRVFNHNSEMLCFQLNNRNQTFTVDTNYFIGVDWLVPEHAALYVEPKLNEHAQVDFLGMLLESLENSENLEHIDGLFHVDYDSAWIDIPEQKDRLSPILIVQFLKLVQRIIKKGLKKSYYRVTQNLNSKIKGKILVGQQIKENIVKNRLTKTICNYQEYGFNSLENQFLKLVLKFVSSYLNQNTTFFNRDQSIQLQHILSYCLPSFEHVDNLARKHERIHIKNNIFFREYEEAIKIGEYILKRFSFNISKIGESQASTPPFWIDMSKLFELFVFGKLKKIFPEPLSVSYHDKFWGGKETDILLSENGFKCVVDCKYKPHIHLGNPSLEDKRQIVGYTRLRSVYKKLNEPHDKIIRALVIYSHQDCEFEILRDQLFENGIEEYVELYKLGVRLPELKLQLG